MGDVQSIQREAETPRKRDVADAVRVLSLLIGPNFTGKLVLHFRRGSFEHMELPPETISASDLQVGR